MASEPLLRLAARMRDAGSPVGVGEVLAAHRALAAIDPMARDDVYFALRAVLCASHADLARFGEAWAQTFVLGSPRDPLLDDLMRTAREALPRAAVPTPGAPPAAAAPAEEPEPVPAAWSVEELLVAKDFSAYTDAERALARALLQQLARRGPQRPSRRSVPAGRGERLDLRATARASLRRGGHLVERRYRRHGTRPRKLVLVLDVSGSMDPYARMLLQYAHAAVAARRRVEAFAFGTQLTRLTLELEGRDPDRALQRATHAVVDMGGGTRIGAALAALNREHGRRLGRGAVAVIMSDGWDRGEPAELAGEMARLRRCTHRLIWLNPLAAREGYEPLTRGMRAALPHTDHLLPGNSIASLAELAELLDAV